MAAVEDFTQVPETADVDINIAGEEEFPGEREQDIIDGEAGGPDEDEDKVHINPHTIFLEYLKSPIVELSIGGSSDNPTYTEETTLFTAHQAILTQSPSSPAPSPSSAKATPSTYLSPPSPSRLKSASSNIKTDPSLPAIDDTGTKLLKHARVYTLAEKLGLPDLKTLAHSKIHCINSTPVGEIAYARYMYGNTAADDVTIRKPVAVFWATRSHVLRHEAGSGFQQMCLEYPQFGFDVPNLVLDQKEKRARDREEDSTSGGIKGRKRMRPSVNV